MRRIYDWLVLQNMENVMTLTESIYHGRGKFTLNKQIDKRTWLVVVARIGMTDT